MKKEQKRGSVSGMLIILACVIIILFVGLYYGGILSKKDTKSIIPLEQLQSDFDDGKVCFNEQGECFQISLQKTPEERKAGLMYNTGIRDDQGMLFLFEEEGKHGIWMKNMIIPLDILWLDKNGVVVFHTNNTQPCKGEVCPTITNNESALYVLEINAGMAKKQGITIGSKASINIINK
ncbi:MAG: DUF192 domain-containing protein [Nanoarchaeota archaeon]